MSLIDELKEISIVGWLESNGYPVVKETESKAWVRSPFRNEEKPSFVVFKNNNTWCDYGRTSRTASIIDLVQELNNCDTSTAMKILMEEEDTIRFEPVEVSSEPLISVTKVLDKYIAPDLLIYLKSRGISEKTYNRFTKETYYSFRENPEKTYHAVGFLNDSGGYEVRNAYHKYCISPKDSTTFIVGSPSCSIFEGTFDFLSAVEYFGEALFETDVYVANGLGLLYRHLDRISRYKIVNVYLDLGIGADNSIELIRSRMYDGIVKDHRYLFKGKKDLNDFWVGIKNK